MRRGTAANNNLIALALFSFFFFFSQMSKARVKLNIKMLYRADGYAVKELLKISSLLYDAIKLDSSDSSAASSSSSSKGASSASSSAPSGDAALHARLEEFKEAKNLASEIVDSGAKLYSLLGREGELRESREKALHFLDSISLHMEGGAGSGGGDPHALIDRSIREQVAVLTDNVNELERMHSEADKESRTLKSKIERKTTELERAEKRLKSLQKVKPAFLAEYEHLENELKSVYESYLEKFRNLHHLEHELGKYHKQEMEKKGESDRALKRMQKR